MDVRQHNQDIKNTIAELLPEYPDDAVIVMSLANRDRNSTAGHVCECTVSHAARLIVENTYRIATPDEVEAFRARCKNEQARIEAAELTRAGQRLRILK
jgi:hypothetical protein